MKAYGRDLEAFTEFCDRHYARRWTWATIDRLGMRGFLGELQRRGLSKRSAARALSAVRSLYRFLQENHGVANNIARAAKVPKLDKRLPTYMGREQTRRCSTGPSCAPRATTSPRRATSPSSSCSTPPGSGSRS